MRQVANDDITAFLSRYGWHFHEIGARRWATGWQGDKRAYPLTVELCDTWVSFEVVPFMKLDIDWDSWPDVMRFILELNYSAQMVSLGLNQDRQLILQTQILTENLTYETFADTLSLVGYYAESLYDSIMERIFSCGVLYDHGNRLLT